MNHLITICIYFSFFLLYNYKHLFYFQDGKQNHVSFPEFQQNGTAKQFSHGKHRK